MYNDFVIHLEGLKLGEHNYLFLLNDEFFDALDYSLISKGNVEVQLSMMKKERLNELTFSYSGQVELQCDSCGDVFNYPIDFSSETILKYGEEEFLDEGIWEISIKEKEINVAHFLYETLCLSIPSRVTHLDSADGTKCDEEQLRKLEEFSSKKQKNDLIDPRWEALNKLK